MDKRKALVIAVVCIVFVGSVAYFFYVWSSQQKPWSPQQELAHFENYYSGLMKNLNAEENITIVRSWFERDYNYTELCQWVYSRIEYVPLNESCNRSTNPVKILENGEGRCEEFGVIYVATCLAHDINSRLIVATNVSNPNHWDDLHIWAEVKDNNNWVHVDPSGNVWNKPSIYETGPWGKDIGSTVRIYAIEEGSCEEVTSKYVSAVTET